jgi:hypothetical protein
MDLKVLFHNPEELTDDELALARQKITFQRSMPWVTAVFGGFSVFLLERAILRRTRATNAFMAAGAVAGFWLGNANSSSDGLVSTDYEKRTFDREIYSAFDRKYMNTVLNATGFGNNHINIRDFSDTNAYKKPY